MSDSGGRVRFEPLSSEQVPEAAEVLSRAFRAEPISARLFDLEDPAVQGRHCRAMARQLHAALNEGDPVFVALADDRVVGAAATSRLGWRQVLSAIRAWAALLPQLRRGTMRIGFAARPSRRVPRPYLLLNALGVEPGYEGRGIGRTLLERVLEHCTTETRCTGVYIQTAGDRSRKIYERAGFDVIDEHSVEGLRITHLFWARRPAG